jgi:hypothetical protein
MNLNKLLIIMTCCLIMAGFLLLEGCGGGGNGNGNGNGNATVPPSTMTLTVEVASVPAGTALGTLHSIITVPAGVDIGVSANGQVSDGLIKARGTAATGYSYVIGNFNSSTRQLTFDVVSPSAGFGNGVYAAITFDVATGATVTAANFTVISALGKDYTTAATVPGVTINLK